GGGVAVAQARSPRAGEAGAAGDGARQTAVEEVVRGRDLRHAERAAGDVAVARGAVEGRRREARGRGGGERLGGRVAGAGMAGKPVANRRAGLLCGAVRAGRGAGAGGGG